MPAAGVPTPERRELCGCSFTLDGDEVLQRRRVHLREYVSLADGRELYRFFDPKTREPGEWLLSRSDPGIARFWLVVKASAGDHPNHWSLFVAPYASKNNRGSIYKVRWDGNRMYHSFHHNAEGLPRSSGRAKKDYETIVLNRSLTEEEWSLVEDTAYDEDPEDPADAPLNCQIWVLRVLLRLQRDEILSREDYDWIRSKLEMPVRQEAGDDQ